MPRNDTAIESALEVLTAALQDPVNANVCAKRMLCAAGHLEVVASLKHNDQAAMAKYLRQCSGLFRAGVKFATCKMSEAQHQAITRRLCDCRCDMEQIGMVDAHIAARSQGETGYGPSVVSILETLSVLGGLMCAAMNMAHLTRNKYFSGDNRNKAGQLMWPQGPEDLLPYGPSDSVAGLDLWLREDCGYLILSFIVRLAETYKPFAVCLVDAPAFSVALVRPLQHLTNILDKYERYTSFTEEGIVLPQHDFLNFSIRIILLFFSHSWNHNPDTWFRMLSSPCGNAILKQAKGVLGRVLDLIPAMRSSNQHFNDLKSLEETLGILYSYAKGDFDARGFLNADAIHPSLSWLLNQNQSPELILETALQSLRRFRKGACSDIECPPSSDATYAMLCTQCQVVRFCSKKCQTHAWRHKMFPHKVLCQKINNLRQQLGAENWTRVFKLGFSPQEFIDMCRQKDAVNTAVEVERMLSDTAECRRMFRAEDKGEYVPRPWA